MKASISQSKRVEIAFSGSKPSPMPLVIALVSISLVAVTIIAALFARSTGQAASQRNLEDAVEIAIDGIIINLNHGVSQLNGIQGLFNASEHVTREEFGVFVERFLEESHGVQALEWIPRIRASQKAQYIKSVRQEGFQDFIIHPATEAKDVFPVTYLAPFEGNVTALGFDLFSEDVRRAALIKA